MSTDRNCVEAKTKKNNTQVVINWNYPLIMLLFLMMKPAARGVHAG